jgi:hypothetical protein
MTTDTLIAAAAALVGALLALTIYHAAYVRPTLSRLAQLANVHDGLIGGGAGAAARLSQLDSGVAEQDGLLKRVADRVSEIEARTQLDVSRLGFVRYNAFDDTGSEQSYALALLNRAGDGVVLTSLYSRNDTRTFAKAVNGFKPAAQASEEEVRAIERARNESNA